MDLSVLEAEYEASLAGASVHIQRSDAFNAAEQHSGADDILSVWKDATSLPSVNCRSLLSTTSPAARKPLGMSVRSSYEEEPSDNIVRSPVLSVASHPPSPEKMGLLPMPKLTQWQPMA